MSSPQIQTAVHLVAADVDVSVIRSWLSHAQLDTTDHYAQANLETKRKALERVDAKLRPTKQPKRKCDADLLALAGFAVMFSPPAVIPHGPIQPSVRAGPSASIRQGQGMDGIENQNARLSHH